MEKCEYPEERMHLGPFNTIISTQGGNGTVKRCTLKYVIDAAYTHKAVHRHSHTHTSCPHGEWRLDITVQVLMATIILHNRFNSAVHVVYGSVTWQHKASQPASAGPPCEGEAPRRHTIKTSLYYVTEIKPKPIVTLTSIEACTPVCFITWLWVLGCAGQTHEGIFSWRRPQR